MRVGTFRSGDETPFVGEVDDGQVHPLAAGSILDWLAGNGCERAGQPHPLADVKALAPVPRPPSVRDFFAFEGHVAAGWRLRGADIPEYWYEAPVFYFSNPASIRGPGVPVHAPRGAALLDFELEIAAVIGGGGKIAGFTLMNDWSARDIQAREMTVLLGPHKAKDFATSLGPLIVTPDELPFDDGRLGLEGRVIVNGTEIASSDAAAQHFSWNDLVAHAGRDTKLLPGDVLGSGTLTGGCLLELGALPKAAGGDGERWLRPGDEVVLEADGLGRLETPVTAA
jgi:fumarylacetoacetate (FAA) hydrolase